MARESFVFYRSFYEATKDIEPEDQAALLMGVCEYALDGIEPKLTGVSSAMFKLIKPQIDANNKRYSDGMKGGRPRKEKPVVMKNETSGFEKTQKSKPNVNVNVNENVNDNENVNVSEGLTPQTAPTLDEVRAYCTERKNTVDPVRFVEYYQMREWKLSGGKPMKDWKAAVRYWETREKKEQPAAGTKFSNFEGRQQSEEEMNDLIRAQYKRMVEDDGTHVKD